jgi:hypothetical protein
MPAGREKSAFGISRAKPTKPAFAGEWVSSRTRSGYAIAVAWLPAFERSRPD